MKYYLQKEVSYTASKYLQLTGAIRHLIKPAGHLLSVYHAQNIEIRCKKVMLWAHVLFETLDLCLPSLSQLVQGGLTELYWFKSMLDGFLKEGSSMLLKYIPNWMFCSPKCLDRRP